MGTTIREYETLFVLNPELTDDQVQDVLGRLKEALGKMNGELMREDSWGKKKLAYMIQKQGRGHFVNFHYLGKPGVVEELERTMRNLEGVIRFLTTGHGPVSDVEAKRTEIEKRAREEEAARAKREAEKAERAAAEGSMKS